jgi:acetyl-CoA C-acetyltransferase
VAYGIKEPANVYPLFENALRGHYGRSLEEHQECMGELYQCFNSVAAANPLSWFPTRRSAEEIATATEQNRYVGFPYTKYLNSVIQVNMGASLVLTSVAKARELGVPESKFVYLHGCADGNDAWHLHERTDYHSSPAIRGLGERALAMAGKRIDEIDFFDLYSCFPSAVQIACDALGVAHDDPRGLTVTGGLPYFGGPGNNYVTHAIAHMMERLRAKPGSVGLLNGNGWFVTKHAMGVYSTAPPIRDWQRDDPAGYQSELLGPPHPPFTENPAGPATVETYTVLNGRRGLEGAIVVGRLQDGTRFLADAPKSAWTAMMEHDMLGATGEVTQVDGRNVFAPASPV